MTDTLLRHWNTLRLVPRAPYKTTADDICQKLEDQGYKVSKRTIERDLEKLSAVFPFGCDDRNKPYGWYWQKNAAALDVPAMDMPTALTFQFVKQYLEPLFPASVRNHLAPHIDTATKVLNAGASRRLPRWPEKVIVIPQGQLLHAPATDQRTMDTVYEAVLQDQRLEITYRPRSGDGNPKEYTLNPLGLVLRNQVCYLVATAFDYTDILQFALHRIDEATLLDEKSKTPKGFSLKVYVEQGAFAYPMGDTIKLKIIFDRAVAYHLYETPLSDDQRIEDIDDKRVRIIASVQDTSQLRWWLLGFGDQVEVKAPTALRKEIATSAQSTAKLYEAP